MKVICPKCQFENHANSTRVVCARCATIIDVRMDLESGLDSNGRRQTAKIPYPSNPSNSQPQNSQGSNSQPFGGSNSQPLGNSAGNSGGLPQDVYATRIGDEFDDVLDIPRPSQQNYQTTYDSSPVFDDVFSTPGYDSTVAFDYTPERKTPSHVDSFASAQTGIPRQRQTQDYSASPEPEFMGWPVLPETSVDEEDPSPGFSSGRGGLLARIVLGALVFGLLVFGAYYFLGDLISKRKDQAENPAANNGTLNAGSTEQSGQAAIKPPVTAPSVDLKPAETQPPAATSNVTKTLNPPPVITPKPAVETNQSANAAGAKGEKNGSKPVDIPPMTGPAQHSTTTKSMDGIAKAPIKGSLTIQVASYNDQGQANDRASRLRSANVDARVVRADIPGKGTWYRVQIGGFASREEAMNFGNQLRSKGAVQDFIVTTIGK